MTINAKTWRSRSRLPRAPTGGTTCASGKRADSGEEGRPVWLGAATFDRGVGFSHRDAKITHHIAPDIDAERDLLSADLKDAKVVESTYEVGGIGPTINGHNGGGDSYFTDGEIKFSVLTDGCSARAATTDELENPPLIEAHDRDLAGDCQSGAMADRRARGG